MRKCAASSLLAASLAVGAGSSADASSWGVYAIGASVPVIGAPEKRASAIISNGDYEEVEIGHVSAERTGPGSVETVLNAKPNGGVANASIRRLRVEARDYQQSVASVGFHDTLSNFDADVFSIGYAVKYRTDDFDPNDPRADGGKIGVHFSWNGGSQTDEVTFICGYLSLDCHHLPSAPPDPFENDDCIYLDDVCAFSNRLTFIGDPGPITVSMAMEASAPTFSEPYGGGGILHNYWAQMVISVGTLENGVWRKVSFDSASGMFGADAPFAFVPLPAPMAMLVAGLGLLGAARRRRQGRAGGIA